MCICVYNCYTFLANTLFLHYTVLCLLSYSLFRLIEYSHPGSLWYGLHGISWLLLLLLANLYLSICEFSQVMCLTLLSYSIYFFLFFPHLVCWGSSSGQPSFSTVILEKMSIHCFLIIKMLGEMFLVNDRLFSNFIFVLIFISPRFFQVSTNVMTRKFLVI